MLVGARHLLQEQRRIDDAEIIGAEGPQPHHTKIRVPHHHRIGRAPLVAGEEPRVQVVDITLERRLEAVFPAQDGGQDRDVLSGERVLAGAEQIGKLPGRHELHQLRFTDDQLRTVLDLLVLVRPAKRQRVTRVVRPFDDINELVADDVEQSVHAHSPSRAGRRASPVITAPDAPVPSGSTHTTWQPPRGLGSPGTLRPTGIMPAAGLPCNERNRALFQARFATHRASVLYACGTGSSYRSRSAAPVPRPGANIYQNSCSPFTTRCWSS